MVFYWITYNRCSKVIFIIEVLFFFCLLNFFWEVLSSVRTIGDPLGGTGGRGIGVGKRIGICGLLKNFEYFTGYVDCVKTFRRNKILLNIGIDRGKGGLFSNNSKTIGTSEYDPGLYIINDKTTSLT